MSGRVVLCPVRRSPYPVGPGSVLWPRGFRRPPLGVPLSPRRVSLHVARIAFLLLFLLAPQLALSWGALGRVQAAAPVGPAEGPYLQFSIGGQAPVGELDQPVGVSAGDRGVVAVADTEHHIVQLMSEDGRFLRRIGSPGTREGQFFRPTGVAVHHDKVFVVDSGNQRVQVFDLSGKFERAWGKWGNGKGMFNNPTAIAIDPAGSNVYVADEGRVQQFDQEGDWQWQWGREGLQYGTVFGLEKPTALVVSPDNLVYVADARRSQGRVFCFNANGDYQYTLPVSFQDPRGLGASPKTRLIYVADARTNSVSIFEHNPKVGQHGAATLQGSLTPSPAHGALSRPQGLAVARDTGKVLVADSGNNRVVVFGENATSLDAWGREGHGEYQFFRPGGMALGRDPEDNLVLYIADTGNSRIRVRTPGGEQVDVWGRWGNEKGSFDQPSDVAVGPGGDVFVVDKDNHRVQRFDNAGQWEAAWGQQGSADGEFSFPSGIAIDAEGRVYVADTENHRVQIFDADGELLEQWDPAGGYPFDRPADVAVAEDQVFVSDQGAHCVWVYDTAGVAQGEPLGTPDAASLIPGRFDSPTHLAVWTPSSDAPAIQGDCNNGKPLLYVLDTGNDRVQSFKIAEGNGLHLSWGSPAQFSRPGGIATKGDGTVYVADTGNHRILSLTCGGSEQNAWHPQEERRGQLGDIAAVARDEAGRILVADREQRRVYVFGAEGLYSAPIGDATGEGALVEPAGVAVDDDWVYVTDKSTHRLVRYTLTGAYDSYWGGQKQSGLLVKPASVTAANGKLYVVEPTRDRVRVLSTAGEVLGDIGPTEGDGKLDDPRDVAVTAQGVIYVVDATRRRVQVYAADGTYSDGWGSERVGDGKAMAPVAVAIDAEAEPPLLLVADAENHRVLEFGLDGAYRGQWCRYGIGDYGLRAPSDIAVGPGGLRVVADQGNDRVQVFGPTYPTAGRGEYMDNPWLTHQPVMIRAGDKLELVAAPSAEPPYGGIQRVHDYGVRWQGIMTPTMPYWSDLTVERQGAVRIWVNDDLLVDAWNEPTEESEVSEPIPVSLSYRPCEGARSEQGRCSDVSLRVEYADWRDLGSLKLTWGPLHMHTDYFVRLPIWFGKYDPPKDYPPFE